MNGRMNENINNSSENCQHLELTQPDKIPCKVSLVHENQGRLNDMRHIFSNSFIYEYLSGLDRKPVFVNGNYISSKKIFQTKLFMAFFII
jgi:hypothetical protein